MTKLNATYKRLKAELELLKELADLQTHHYVSSRKLLHEGLSKVYLWWKDANTHEGLLEKLYDEYNIQFKRATIHEIQFTPLLRYLWNMHATINSNTLDQWNRALNKIHIAVQNDKEYYKTNTEQKLITFIANSGGITSLAGYASYENSETEIKKNKLPKSAEIKLRDAHLTLGNKFFATKAKPIANILTKQVYPSNNGFSVALIRKSENGYEVLGTVDDKEIVHCIKNLVATHAGTGFMHESFHKDDPTKFTRKWFAWANTLFGELIMKVYNERRGLLREV